MPQAGKKLVLVLTIIASMTEIRKKDEILVRILYTYYSIQLKNNIINTKFLLDLGTEVKVITLAYP